MSDLISRAAVLNAMRAFANDDMTSTEKAIGADYCMDIVKSLPSAEPERKKGRWIDVTNGRGGHECNQCHNYAPAWQTGEERLTDFCPNCGADMRGGEK